MRARVVAIGLVIAALLAGSFAVRAKGRITRPPASTPAQGLQTAVPVAVAMVRRADIVMRVLAPGSVTSIRDSKIGSRISGRVAVVLVEEGQQVQTGTPLLRLETSDFVAQEAQAQAMAHLQVACEASVDINHVPGMAVYAYPLKALGDAFVIANDLTVRLEAAAATADPQERARLLILRWELARIQQEETRQDTAVHD